MAKTSKYVKSAARVLDIFELLRSSDRQLILKEISKALNIPVSSLHALVNTLMPRDYLVKDEVSQTYSLGPALISLSGHAQETVDLIKSSDEALTRISRACGESVSLGILKGSEVVFIHKKVSNKVVRVVNPIGTRLPAHSTALGKCILASLEEEKLFSIYPDEDLFTPTSNTITTRTELFKLLWDLRDQGIADDREESAIGVFAVGCPIKDHFGEVIAAISIAAPVDRANDIDVRQWENLLRNGASVISSKLGSR